MAVKHSLAFSEQNNHLQMDTYHRLPTLSSRLYLDTPSLSTALLSTNPLHSYWL